MKSRCVVTQHSCKWYLPNGEYHRIDGPAIKYSDGSEFWYLNGIEIRNKDDIALFPLNEKDLIYLKLKYGF